MSPNEKKARELAKERIKTDELFYGDACKKMAKEASPEKKKEIEDFHTKKMLELIKKEGLEKVETTIKANRAFLKAMLKHTNSVKKLKTAKNIKRNANINKRTTCKFNKKQGSYVSHTGL